MRWVERGWGDKFLSITRGKCEQGFRRTAARNKPAGIRSLVYGIGKGKVRIEGLSVLDQAERDRLFGRFLAIAD